MERFGTDEIDESSLAREYSCFSLCDSEDLVAHERQLLLAVDDSDESQAAIRWLLDNVYRQGEDRLQSAGAGSRPPPTDATRRPPP